MYHFQKATGAILSKCEYLLVSPVFYDSELKSRVVGWGCSDMGGDQILLMAPEMSLLCSGVLTAETKSMLNETVE